MALHLRCPPRTLLETWSDWVLIDGAGEPVPYNCRAAIEASRAGNKLLPAPDAERYARLTLRADRKDIEADPTPELFRDC